MTRRMAMAILLTVWTRLLFAGLGVYVITRSMLLDDLDESIQHRAASVPELTDAEGRHYFTEPAPYSHQDRMWSAMLWDDRSHDRDRLAQAGTDQPPAKRGAAPKVIGKSFSATGGGSHVRTLRCRRMVGLRIRTPSPGSCRSR